MLRVYSQGREDECYFYRGAAEGGSLLRAKFDILVILCYDKKLGYSREKIFLQPGKILRKVIRDNLLNDERKNNFLKPFKICFSLK